jgi:hypothetical protein
MPFKKPYKRKTTRKGVSKATTQKIAKATTQKIAKQVVKSELKKTVELKYMDTVEFRGQQPYLPPNPSARKFSCVGFSTSKNGNSVGGEIQYPAGHGIEELEMLRPFHTSASPSNLRKYAIDGREINPIQAQTKYVITRDISEMKATLTVPVTGQNDNRLPPFTQVMPGKVALGCPVVCRMIEVIPSLSSGINKDVRPADDLFLDTYGTSMGVDTVGIDNYDILTCKVNKRRYKVKKDIKFQIQNPFNVNWVPVHQADPPGSSGGGNTIITAYQPQLANNSRFAQKFITSNYQLSQRKGGKIFYDDPNIDENATAGHQRTYTFFHFVYVGGDDVTGSDYEVHAPLDIRIDTHSISKFSDM